MTTTLELTRGQSAIVDEDVFEEYKNSSWFAIPHRNGFYAARYSTAGTEYLHRLILGLRKGDSRQGDHINRNTLDNQKENLRITTLQQNSFNIGATRRSRYNFKGVCFEHGCSNKPWRASLIKQGKNLIRSFFCDAQEAKTARIAAEQTYSANLPR